MAQLRSQTEQIKARAKSLGFSIVGITHTEPLQEHGRYKEWISKQYHAGMKYLATPYHIDTRRDPRLLLPNAQSVIVVGFTYPLHSIDILSPLPVGVISSYAAGEDYHDYIPRLLEQFVQSVRSDFGQEIAARICTDSAPILERELAQRAGLGWIGKNSCLISPQIGSALLLAEVLLDLKLEIDPPFQHDYCGTCNRCVLACPTGCIQNDRTIDANRCISYQTIENRGEIPPELMHQSGNWIFGCDVCQMVCPWNKKRITTFGQANKELIVSVDQMTELLTISEQAFQQQFGSTALARTKRNGLLRNLLIRLGNLANSETIPAIQRLIDSTSDPVLLHTAQWALERMDK